MLTPLLTRPQQLGARGNKYWSDPFNVFDASIGAIVWWVCGYGIALGADSFPSDGKNGMIGSTYYTAVGTNGYGDAMWLFQWAFAGAAATIVSGAVAERVTFTAYIIYSVVLTAFICA